MHTNTVGNFILCKLQSFSQEMLISMLQCAFLIVECSSRLEMSAELLRQKELENLHRQRLLADPLGLHPGLPAEHPALRSLHEIPEGHPLREELNRRNAMLVLRHNNTPLLSLNHQGAAVGTSSKDLSNRKSLRKGGPLRGDQQGVCLRLKRCSVRVVHGMEKQRDKMKT